MRISCNGTELYVDIEGSQLVQRDGIWVERPTLLLLHGGPGPDHTALRSWTRALADCAQLVYFDQRGHGRSARSDAAHWTLETWADDAAALCAALGLRKPLILGVSFGGMVAQQLALRHPDLAAGMILVSTTAHTDLQRVWAGFERFGGAAAREAAVAFYADPAGAGNAEQFLRRCIPLYSVRAGAALGASLGAQHWSLEVTAHFQGPAGEWQRMDLRPRLSAVRAPTLILGGYRDPITPEASQRELHAAFASGIAQLHLYENASHALALDAGADLLQRIRSFVRHVSPEAAPT